MVPYYQLRGFKIIYHGGKKLGTAQYTAIRQNIKEQSNLNDVPTNGVVMMLNDPAPHQVPATSAMMLPIKTSTYKLNSPIETAVIFKGL